MPDSLYTAEYIELRRRLIQARTEAGLTQEQVAERFGGDWDQTRVSYIETARRHVYWFDMLRFAKLYNKPLTWFVPDDNADS